MVKSNTVYFTWKPDPSVHVATFLITVSSSSPKSLTPAAFVSWDLPRAHLSAHRLQSQSGHLAWRSTGTLGSTPGAHTWFHSHPPSLTGNLGQVLSRVKRMVAVCCLTPAILSHSIPWGPSAVKGSLPYQTDSLLKHECTYQRMKFLKSHTHTSMCF